MRIVDPGLKMGLLGMRPMSTIDTSKAERRRLQFRSIDDVLAEIDRIVEAERKGTLRTTGNWTAGQVFNHLATWINYGYEGFPSGANPPWFIKLILKPMKKKYLRDGMRPGVKIPRVKDGTFGTEPMGTAEGAAKLKKALAALKNREPVKFHSPAFGAMPDNERVAFQLRHAELHLGFLSY